MSTSTPEGNPQPAALRSISDCGRWQQYSPPRPGLPEASRHFVASQQPVAASDTLEGNPIAIDTLPPINPPQPRPHAGDADFHADSRHVHVDQIVFDCNMIELMLAHIVLDPRVFAAAIEGEMAQRSLFDGAERVYQTVWLAALEHHTRYGQLPGREALETLALAFVGGDPHENAADQHAVTRLVRWIWATYPTGESLNSSLAMDLLKRFLRDRIVRERLSTLKTELDASVLAGPALATALTELTERVARIDSLGQTYDGMSFGELLDSEFERLDIVRNIVIGGQCTLFAGPAGLGKTLTAAINLPLSIATGDRWLEQERFACDRPRRVAVWSTESGPEVIKRQASNMLNRKLDMVPAGNDHGERQREMRELARENLRFFLRHDDMPDLSTAAGLRKWAGQLRRGNFEVAMVDSVLSAFGGAELKDPSKMYAMLNDIRRAAFDAGVLSVVLSHHNVEERGQPARKGFQHPRIESAAYPAFVRWARQKIALGVAGEYDAERHVSQLFMAIKGSGLIAGGTFQLTFSEGTNYDHWQVQLCEPVARIVLKPNRPQTMPWSRQSSRS